MTLDRLVQPHLLALERWFFANAFGGGGVHDTPMISRTSLCMTVVVCAFSVVAAEDWPEFRGPTGQGISQARNVPVSWSASNNVAWKTTTIGNGWSSPVLHQGRLYITSALENGQSLSLRAQCYDALTGKLIWD